MSNNKKIISNTFLSKICGLCNLGHSSTIEITLSIFKNNNIVSDNFINPDCRQQYNIDVIQLYELISDAIFCGNNPTITLTNINTCYIYSFYIQNIISISSCTGITLVLVPLLKNCNKPEPCLSIGDTLVVHI